MRDFPSSAWRATELAKLQAQFPGFNIWLEGKGELTLFVAQRLRDDLHPHTLVTTNPDKIRMHLAVNNHLCGS